MALCYSVAEYCSPVWSRSSHSKTVDRKLNESMRIITGCLKSTPVQWLPTLSSIAPPHIRREEATQKIISQLEEMEDNIPLKRVMKSAPTSSRLRSRRPFYKVEANNSTLFERWKEEWARNKPNGGSIIEDPTQRPPGFEKSTRKQWVTSNRLLTGHGRTASNMHKWGLRESPICQRCGETPETTDYIVLQCPVSRLKGGYKTVLECDDPLKTWIDSFRVEV